MNGSLSGSLHGPLDEPFPWVAGFGIFPGQAAWVALAPNADFFPLTHGRWAVVKSQSAPQALRLGFALDSAMLWWVTTGLVALVIAVLVLLRHFRSHLLRSRVSYDLLPTTTFDPSLDAVRAFGHQLGRARPVHGWLPSSLSAVRVRFRTDDQGKLIMGIEGRESITGVLNRTPYSHVELLRRVEQADGGEPAPVASGGEFSSTRDGEGEVASPAGGGDFAPTTTTGGELALCDDTPEVTP